MNEAIATNTQANKDAIDRAVTSTLNLERRMIGREDANRQRAADRAQAVADANAALQQKVGQTQAPAEIDPKASGNFTTSVAGTFSAFGLGQLGSGNIDKQQLDELKRIREELQRQARMGGIGP
jgi:hypothetical protein